MTVFQNIQRGLIPARLTVEEVYASPSRGYFATVSGSN